MNALILYPYMNYYDLSYLNLIKNHCKDIKY